MFISMERMYEKHRVNGIVGMNVREVREARQLHKDDLARYMGLSSSHVGLIERGERGATAVSLSKLAKALDVPIDIFFTGHERDTYLEGKDPDSHASRLKIINTVNLLQGRDLEVILHLINGIISINDNM